MKKAHRKSVASSGPGLDTCLFRAGSPKYPVVRSALPVAAAGTDNQEHRNCAFGTDGSVCATRVHKTGTGILAGSVQLVAWPGHFADWPAQRCTCSTRWRMYWMVPSSITISTAAEP